ncbi:unnamed protein product [Spirodela intermedia]|uniref:Uncharacterized protein n=1 Tax=Spirodela intermedia TaxID=51605 RepID=A0A7I8K2Q3_SPIIN|nr:unnamed protein product [Spirodela intermedia]
MLFQFLAQESPPEFGVLLRELPFCSANHGLPPNAENTDCLRHHHILCLCRASESLRPHFERLLRDAGNWDGEPPLCIVADVFFARTVEVSRELTIFHTIFFTCGALGRRLLLPLFHVPGFPDGFRLLRSQMSGNMRPADGKDACSFFQWQISLSLRTYACLCNAAEDLETTGMRLLREITGLRVWPVGPLVAMERTREPRIGAETCAEWLGLRPLHLLRLAERVVSVADDGAGGGADGERRALHLCDPVAIGFDLSEGSDMEWLRNKGLLVRGWALQLEILSHPSTAPVHNTPAPSLATPGGTHHWRASARVPVIGQPLATEQFDNSKMMEEEMGCAWNWRGVWRRRLQRRRWRGCLAGDWGQKGVEMRGRTAELSRTTKAAVAEKGAVRCSSLRAFDEFIYAAQTAPPADQLARQSSFD